MSLLRRGSSSSANGSSWDWTGPTYLLDLVIALAVGTASVAGAIYLETAVIDPSTTGFVPAVGRSLIQASVCGLGFSPFLLLLVSRAWSFGSILSAGRFGAWMVFGGSIIHWPLPLWARILCFASWFAAVGLGARWLHKRFEIEITLPRSDEGARKR